jgi:predicted ATPase/DNA-binding CsgD family transcriptional regulator
LGAWGASYASIVAPYPRADGALQAAASRFIGRRGEIAEVRRLLGTSHVVTLAGPPGVGKTRLALGTAEETARSFPDGVWFVDLAGLHDPALVAQEVAGALGLTDATTRWAVEGLARHIGARTAMLVLDNCEHLLDACAIVVDSLSRTCKSLRVLTTSRQSLGIDGEAVFRVSPLSVPEEGSVDGDAVRLLPDRATAAVPGFAADESDLHLAAVLCRRLDGIPLAIELAAVRLKTLTLQQMLERLDDLFSVLGRRERTGPLHQRTLRAALDWSRDLMSDAEGVLWRRVSVFPTTFDLAAAEAVCSGDGLAAEDIFDTVDGLVDKSIVTAARAGSLMRYRLLSSIRAYGLEALQYCGEVAARADRHSRYYAALARQGWSHWTDQQQPEWFDRLDAEHDNLRAALDWLAERDLEAGCAMAADLWLYWGARGHLTEGRRRLGALLEALDSDSALRPRTLWVAGYLAVAQTDPEDAVGLLHKALDAATAIRDEVSIAFATQYLAQCQLFSGDLESAEQLFDRAYRMHRSHGDRAASFALTDLAVTVMVAGDLERAVRLYEEALEMTDAGGDPWTRSHAFWGLGVATFLLGDLDRAEQAEKGALDLIGLVDERSGIALCLEALAWVAAARGDFGRASRLQGASTSLWESIPGKLPEPVKEQALTCAQLSVRALGASQRDRMFQDGRRLERAQAVAFGLGRRTAPSAAAEQPTSVLTKREDEVAALVAEGLTDRQIARRLVISQRTAESHVQHILSKLGFRSRAQIATWVAKRQAGDPPPA